MPDSVELAIEAMLDQPIRTVDSAYLGKAHRIADAAGRYIEFCKSTISTGVDLSNLKIVVDCANGAGYKAAPKLLKELGAKVVSIGIKPNGLNINLNCGSTYPEILRKHVKKT